MVKFKFLEDYIQTNSSQYFKKPNTELNRARAPKALKRLTTFGARIKCIPYIWDEKANSLQLSARKDLILWALNTTIACVLTIGNLVGFLADTFGDRSQPLQFIFCETMFSLVSAHSCLIQLNTLVFLHDLPRCHRSFQKHQIYIQQRTRRTRDMVLLETVCQLMFNTVIFLPLAVLPILCRQTSTFNLYHLLGGTNFLGTILYSLLTTWLIFNHTANSFFYLLVNFDVIIYLNQWVKCIKEMSENFKSKNFFRLRQFMYKMHLYNCIVYASTLYRVFSCHIVATGLGCLVVAQIICFFGALEFHNTLPRYILFLALVAGVDSFIAVHFILAVGNYLENISKDFLRNTLLENLGGNGDKYIQRQLKGTKPIRIKISNFTYIHSKMSLKCIYVVTNYVYTLLMG